MSSTKSVATARVRRDHLLSRSSSSRMSSPAWITFSGDLGDEKKSANYTVSCSVQEVERGSPELVRNIADEDLLERMHFFAQSFHTHSR